MKSCNSGSDVVGLVLDKTPLYAEQGGQTFDKDLMVFMVSWFQFRWCCVDLQMLCGTALSILGGHLGAAVCRVKCIQKPRDLSTGLPLAFICLMVLNSCRPQ